MSTKATTTEEAAALAAEFASMAGEFAALEVVVADAAAAKAAAKEAAAKETATAAPTTGEATPDAVEKVAKTKVTTTTITTTKVATKKVVVTKGPITTVIPRKPALSKESLEEEEAKAAEEGIIVENVEDASITPLVFLFHKRCFIRILGTVDDPIFCALDVAKYIKDGNYKHIFLEYDQEKYFRWVMLQDSAGRRQRTRFLTEAGLYKYLLQSRRKEAEEFQCFTYDLLKAERKRTVDNAQIALKIAQTERDEAKKEIATVKAMHRGSRIELNDVMRKANDFREERDVAQKKLKTLQTKQRSASMAETRRVEDEENRRRWAPFPCPER